MKLLFSSSDSREVERTLKRLLWARIPCAVGRDPVNSYLAVWIQQESDFPRALNIFVNRNTPRPLPHWAQFLEPAPPVDKPTSLPAADGEENPGVVVLASEGLTRTGTGSAALLKGEVRTARTIRDET